MTQQQWSTRFEWIERLAYWEGKISVTRLAQVYGVSRQQASKILSAYRRETPGNLLYDSRLRFYAIADSFQCRFIRENSDDYLQWLLGIPKQPSVVRIHAPERQIPVMVLRPITRALAHQQAVDCHYAAMSGESQERLIAPHSLIYTAGRWHVRAWCFLRQQYRDFVLSRFLSSQIDICKPCPPSTHDIPWHTQVELIFAPDPRLDESHRQLLAQEYGMTDERLVVSTRAALANYHLQEMGISTRMLAPEPEAQQLVLVNKRDIAQWLYD